MSNIKVMREFEIVKKQLDKATSQLNVMVKKGHTNSDFENVIRRRDMLEERLHDIAEKLT